MKTNKEVLELVKKKKILLSNLRLRQIHMISHTLRRNEELHSIILEVQKVVSISIVQPRTSYKSQLIKDARVDSYRQLRIKGTRKRFLERTFIVDQSTGWTKKGSKNKLKILFIS